MAFTIPESLASRTRVTRGEQRVFDALRDHLPEDYLVYYDTAVSQRHPDFIIVGPDLGLVVLEVKDWRLETIAGDAIVLRVGGGEEITKNPVQQARDYVLRAVDLLKRWPLLRDGEYLRFAWGYGVVFPLLRREDVRRASLFGPCREDALGPGLVLTAEDLAADRLAPVLRTLLPRWAARLEPLAPIHLDAIRGVLPSYGGGDHRSRVGTRRVVLLKLDHYPEVKRFDSAEMSCLHAVEWVRGRLGRGVSPDEILVLGPTWADVEDLAVWLADAGVPARDLRGRGGTGDVRLSTIHCAKGLDAACVITIGAHRATLHGDEEQARRLLYIAMTRARNELCVSYFCVSYYGESRLMSELAPPAGQARHDHD